MMLLSMTRPALGLALALIPCSALLVACQGSEPTAGAAQRDSVEEPMASSAQPPDKTPDGLELATFGAGCYWCVEAVLEQLEGVADVRSGFMGGSVANPSYDAVCSGRTGHAEVVQVDFDPQAITYDELLDWFWRLHDPTTLNRQGADVGTQYRSAIFYHSEAQRRAAEASKAAAQADFRAPIVTEITAAGPFYAAAEYHQDYYRQNKSQGYCRAVIAPKLDKLGLEK
jgi:peptide-methionine (S)-S-oxide reductase